MKHFIIGCLIVAAFYCSGLLLAAVANTHSVYTYGFVAAIVACWIINYYCKFSDKDSSECKITIEDDK